MRLFRTDEIRRSASRETSSSPAPKALLRKEGDRLIVEPMPRRSLLEILSTWDPLDEELPDVDDLGPAEDVNL